MDDTETLANDPAGEPVDVVLMVHSEAREINEWYRTDRVDLHENGVFRTNFVDILGIDVQNRIAVRPPLCQAGKF